MIDVGNLIQGSRIHGSLYRDPEVFERELNEIWYKVWVYVGHESEIPNPGDFVRRMIGRQPVIVVRSWPFAAAGMSSGPGSRILPKPAAGRYGTGSG